MIIRGGGGSSRSASLREPPHHPPRPEHPNHADPTSPVQTFSTASSQELRTAAVTVSSGLARTTARSESFAAAHDTTFLTRRRH